MENFDQAVKRAVYDYIVENAKSPSSAELAMRLKDDPAAVAEALRRLGKARALVVKDTPEPTVFMAMPFSGFETQHRVIVDQKTYFANCAWDAFGISAALHRDARIESSCGFSGEPITYHIRNNRPDPQQGLAHFAIPAAHWWDDVFFT